MGTTKTATYALESLPIETPAERAARFYADFERKFGGTWSQPEVVADPESVAPSAAALEGWENLGFRGQVAKMLRERGHEQQARRFANCNRFGRPGACNRYPFEHKYFLRHGCGMPFCGNCAQEERRRVFDKYFAVFLLILTQLKTIPKTFVLGRITFTLRSDGSAITPEKVKLFNSAVRRAMRGAARMTDGDGRFGMGFAAREKAKA